MSCTINYNKNGSIKNVFDLEGKESRLFKQIARLPHVESLEEALSIFKNVYSEKINDQSPITFISDKGVTFNSYKEALQNSAGGDIQIGMGIENTFKNLVSVSSNTNPASYEGFINNMIKSDILSDQKIIENGKTYHQAAGNHGPLQIVNEQIIKEEAKTNLNRKNFKIYKDGRIELLNNKNKVQVGNKSMSLEDFRATTLRELEKSVSKDEAVELMINNAVKDALPSGISTESLNTNEESLKMNLLDLLNSMGVKVTSINSYINSYNIRNGVDPSAQALLDVSRQVIAFKDGLMTIDGLAEETSHFIVETWDDAEIEGLLRNINKTSSYVEFSQSYRELYTRENPSMSTEQVENLVRREILGKELAKAIQERFNTEGKTEIHKTIIERIFELLGKFFNSVVVKDTFYTDLEALTVKVEDLLLTKDVNKYLNLDKTKTKTFRMYQQQASGNVVLDTKNVIVKRLVKSLLDQERSLRNAGRGSAASIQMLNSALDKAITKSSILDLISLAKRQADYVSTAIETSKRRGETLSNEEGIVLQGLKDNIVPVLSRLVALSKEDADLADIVNDINAVVVKVSAVTGAADNVQNDVLDRIIDRLMIRHSFDDEVRQKLRDAVTTATRDTQLFYSAFGQITHAHDPLLNILGSVIADMTLDAEQSYLVRAKQFQDTIRKLGFTEADLPKFMEKGGYVTSLYDFNAFEKDITDIKLQAYKIHSGTAMSDEDIIKGIKSYDLPKITDEAAEKAYEKEVNDAVNSRVERSFTEDYYQNRDDKYEKLGISDTTKTELRLLSTDLGSLMSRVKNEKGLPRYTSQDKYELDAINLKRKSLKSLFESFGDIKTGLKPVENPSENSIEVSGIYYELQGVVSEEAKIAFEINKLDQAFLAEKQEEARLSGGQKIDIEKLAPKFLEELQKIELEEGREAAVEFFILNSSVGFSNDFWNNFDVSESMMTYIDSYSQDPNSEQAWIEKIKSYKDKLQSRKSILKQYQDSRNFTNTMAEEMSTQQRSKVIELSEEIDRMAVELYTIFKDKVSLGTEENRVSESTPNQSYYDMLADARITTAEGKYKFALENMTVENAKKARQFSDALDDVLKGLRVSEGHKALILRTVGINELSELNKDDIPAAKLKYAETKLAPYYKAFAPVGLQNFYDQLKNGNQNVYTLVTELNKRRDVKVSNNFSYYEMGEIKFKNPNYKEDFEGGSKQPKLSKYLNKNFVDLFRPVLDADNNPILDNEGNIQATTNQKLFSLYKEYMEFQRESLRSYGELGTHNLYLAPQVSKTGLEKANDLIKGKRGTIKEWWRDAVRFRVDEQAFGEEVEGEALVKATNMKIIPKYFLKKLEEETDVSTDLFYSSMLFAQQSQLYKARKERFSEFATLNDLVLKRAYPEGKDATSTNTYKMFQSYYDHNLFGIKERKNWRVTVPVLGQIDVTKIINMLHKLIRDNSLALNVVVPVTSWLTAEASMIIEKYVGQYVDSGSMNLASKEFRKIAFPAMKESLEIDSKSKLSIYGEYFGVFDLSNKFENSMYSKGPRVLAKSKYILHTAGNFAPLSKAMLSQLYGFRIYEGKLVDSKKFESLYKTVNPSATKKDLANQWDLLRDKTLYNYMSPKDGTVAYDYDSLARDMGRTNDEQFQKDFRNIEIGVITKLKKVVERIDGMITNEERTSMQRDVLGRFAMTHKGWLAISAANRFKRRHLNLQTGQMEEGTYFSVYNFFVQNFNNGLQKGGMKSALGELKSQYLNGDDVQRENIRRVMVDFAFLSVLFLLTIGVGHWADDEEDMWAAQFAAYMLERVTTETSSTQFGVIGEFYSSVKEPLVGVQKLENLFNITRAFDTEVEDRGRFKGMTKQQIYFLKNVTGAKPTFDLWNAGNLKSLRDTYDYYNKDESLIPIAILIDENDLKEGGWAEISEEE
jgi:hypothetical protein